MIYPFLALAAVSPTRQIAFRRAIVCHVLAVSCMAWMLLSWPPAQAADLLGCLLLCVGIVEGAVLMGWRLTQLPKSKALEFVLVSPLRPGWLFFGEALVGAVRLALVTLAGLPVFGLLVVSGHIEPADVAVLLLMPFTWGVLTGFGLAVWAYELVAIRRWAERAMLGLVVFYLIVGVLAGENLKRWLDLVPAWFGQGFLWGFEAFHRYNPFGTWRWWVEQEPFISGARMLWVEVAALAICTGFCLRGMARLHGHFHDRHYRPLESQGLTKRPEVGDWPLSWWAVKRVTEYSGRVNLWLAGGFGVLYALFLVAGTNWPAWMGRRVFELFEVVGGVPVIAGALFVLAAVPAAFQYGLWDSNAQDRCRRLELLLLTKLGGRDYWHAACAAAWRRGRGYFAVAVILWVAAVVAGQATLLQGSAALAAGVILWGLYFALGFRAFSRGHQANGLGIGLTLGLPLLAIVLFRTGWERLATLLPPGGLYAPVTSVTLLAWLPGPLVAGLGALAIARFSLARCDGELRIWYDRHHGARGIE